MIKGLFIWRRFTRQGELLAHAGGTNKRSVYMESSYTRNLLHDCRMIAAWRRNGAKTQKGFKSFETLKKHYQMLSKYKNKRRAIQENLSIDSYVFVSYYISLSRLHT
jgi:hypothetical protein